MEINYQTLCEIDTTPTTAPTYVELGAGLDNLTEALNEVIYQAQYLNNAGWGVSEVTGGQMTMSLTGDRMLDDPAQNYIFSDAVKYGFGSARKSNIRLTRPNGSVIVWPITIVNATEAHGKSADPNKITINIHGNGAPQIINAALLGTLKVVSVAGATTGNTAIYVNPAKAALNSYKYKTGVGVTLPVFDEVCTTGWTAWDGAANIVATTGQDIIIVEVVTSTNKAQLAGVAVVTSKA